MKRNLLLLTAVMIISVSFFVSSNLQAEETTGLTATSTPTATTTPEDITPPYPEVIPVVGGTLATDVTVSARLVAASDDKAGIWYVFGPGNGQGNYSVGIQGQANDWTWDMTLNLSTAKTISSIRVKHETTNQGWSTIYSYGYPLIVYKDGTQLNNNYVNSLNLAYDPGTYEFKLYGQIDNTTKSGTRIDITFTDGTYATGVIPDSTIRPVINTIPEDEDPISTSTPASLSATLLDASSDLTDGGFILPGTGAYNKNANDWHWQAVFDNATAKTINSVYILHNTPGEGWSTTDSASMLGKVLRALVVYRNGHKLNSAYNDLMLMPASQVTLDLYGQPEGEEFTGGSLVIGFTDGTKLRAIIPASSIRQDSSEAGGDLSATLLDASTDVTNGGFISPGPGNINKNGNDWHWQLTMNNKTAKTIKSAYIIHNTYGEGWSTTDSPSMLWKVLYALVVFRNGQQQNSAYNEEIQIPAGQVILDLYGQPEGTPFTGGKLVVTFTDGTNAVIKLLASTIAQAGSTVIVADENSMVSEEVKCVFKDAVGVQKCYAMTEKQNKYYDLNCQGSESCVVNIKGKSGDKITWKSSCGGYAYTIIDGANDYAIFYCSDAEQPDSQIMDINEKTKLLSYDNFDFILAELNQLRNQVKEQETEIKYLKSLVKDLKALSEKNQAIINDFITYGVDANTEQLGAGERAAVVNSYKAAFSKLPESENELADMIKIANGRWPSVTNNQAEKKATDQFQKIYKKIPDTDNAQDNAAVTIMAYGLRQKASNRNLNSEKQGIDIFSHVYGHAPASTEEWNIMQAITYSGASREVDSDGDLLTDKREKELGTNPKAKDSDGDGYVDGVEVVNGYDPLKK